MPDILTITGALANSKQLVFKSLSGVEELGRPFEYQLEMVSDSGAIAMENLLGQSISVRIPMQEGRIRWIHGYVSRCFQTEQTEKQHRYLATLRPWIWFLTRTADCRIFQGLTVPKIIEQVFRDNGFTDFKSSLLATYLEREFCVQYRETAFAFVSRLMEHEGIYYFFEHESNKHTLVLCDNPSNHVTREGYAKVAYYPPSENVVRSEHLDELEAWCEVQPTQVTLQDYNYLTPTVNLLSRRNSELAKTIGLGEIYDYPGLYDKTKNGDPLANLRGEVWDARTKRVQIAGNTRGLGAGLRFTLDKHPDAARNMEYLVVASQHQFKAHIAKDAGAKVDLDHYGRHEVMPAKQPFRSDLTTPVPRVHGPQTAVVVGPSKQEIHTDKYGRIKVQFHWDRLGKNDADSSCWIRVAQSWAGKKWGALFLPRIGHEVLVEFLEGDPDRPIVTGSVYNAEVMPPYALPDDQTKSGWKSHSTLDANDKNFNELRFNDKKGEEEIYFHAERDFLRVVENNDTLKVGLETKKDGDQTIVIHNNRSLTVGNKDSKDGSQTVVIWKDHVLTVGGDEKIKIGFGGDGTGKDHGRQLEIAKDHVQKIGNDESVVIGKNRSVTIQQGNDTLEVTQGDHAIAIKAGKSSLDAAKEILLKVGGNSIKIDTQGITIEATKIVLKASTTFDIAGGASLKAKSPMTDVLGDGILTLKGGMVKIN